MNKGVLWGGGLGLLVLAFLGGFWLAGSTPGTPVDVPAAASPAPKAALPAQASGTGLAPAPSVLDPAPNGAVLSQAPNTGSDALNGAPPAARPTKSREERRKVRAQIQALSAELQAKGTNVTMQDVRAYLDKVERLGEGDFDPRYFKTMRHVVDQSARAQDLTRELGKLSQSTAPADVARRKAILAELRDISVSISAGATSIQSYAHEAGAAGKPR